MMHLLHFHVHSVSGMYFKPSIWLNNVRDVVLYCGQNLTQIVCGIVCNVNSWILNVNLNIFCSACSNIYLKVY